MLVLFGPNTNAHLCIYIYWYLKDNPHMLLRVPMNIPSDGNRLPLHCVSCIMTVVDVIFIARLFIINEFL